MIYEDLLRIYSNDCGKYLDCKGCPLLEFVGTNFDLCEEISLVAHKALKEGFDIRFETEEAKDGTTNL